MDIKLKCSKRADSRENEIASSFLLAKTGWGDAVAYAKKAAEIYEAIESPHLDQARALLEGLRDRAD